MLNSNTENPYLIWDNATRAELTEFLEREQSRKIETVNKLYNLPVFVRREPALTFPFWSSLFSFSRAIVTPRLVLGLLSPFLAKS